MEMGAGFPEQLDNAALSRHEKSLVMARCRNNLKFEDASPNMRRLFGPRGTGSRHDALFAEETAESHGRDEDLDILAAHRKAKKQGAGKNKRRALRERARARSKRMGKPCMDLTEKREYARGVTGATASATWHHVARGGTPRDKR